MLLNGIAPNIDLSNLTLVGTGTPALEEYQLNTRPLPELQELILIFSTHQC